MTRRVGRPFALAQYWGPMASARSSRWIAEATAGLIGRRAETPDLCFTYLPGLDYDLQRYGPGSRQARRALREVVAEVELLRAACRRDGRELVVFGDYAIAPVAGDAILPNRRLFEAGLMACRNVGGRLYPDWHASRAFALADHEICHVYVRDAAAVETAAALLRDLPGVEAVLDAGGRRAQGVAHPRAGELLAVAAEGAWFAYPWWRAASEEPDFARHVDIHRKPGYDPCELFFGWPPGSVSRNPRRIRGSHGRVGPSRQAAWAATHLEGEAMSLLDLAAAVRARLEATA
jgi:predicted AlkP superfamily pyrophosphatase or phosphodiesterase